MESGKRKGIQVRIVACACLAAAAVATASPVSVRVEGWGFEVARLDNDQQAFGNRTYVWKQVPQALQGWKFTRLNGGIEARVVAIPEADGNVYLATTPGGLRLEGWRVVPEWRFWYTDANHTHLRVFQRTCRRGERIVIPQGNWTGGILLAPRMTGGPSSPEPDLSRVPGVVIDHSPAYTADYIGDPSIAVLPDGRYVASHSFFGGGARRGTTRVFVSEDRGASWRLASEVPRQWFSTLFVHRSRLYLMGVGEPGSSIVIRRSDDGGRSWTTPRDARTGLLRTDRSYHAAPTPVLHAAGRLWRGMERREGRGGWPRHFRAFVISAPEDADLLLADNWICTNALGPTPDWPDPEYRGWLEGNAVRSPSGEILDILRIDSWLGGTAAILHISPDGRTARFDPRRDFVAFPGGAKKFTIRYDPVSRLYWTLTNPVDENDRGGRGAGAVRNTLTLVCSVDLRHWRVHRRILHHPDPDACAFQYPDWQFDGPDIIAVCRTAFDDGIGGAHNFHDANLFTFIRIHDFRSAVPAPDDAARLR